MADKSGLNRDFSCSVCNSQNNLKRCGICKCTYYCSREHQMKDWNNHKLHCKQLAKQTCSDVRKTTIISDNTRTDGSSSTDVADESKKSESPDSDDSVNKCVIKSANFSEKAGHSKLEAETDDGLPFDMRPYKEQQFIQVPCGLSAVDAAKTAVDKMNEQGYCVLDGLFRKSLINKALADIKKAAAADSFSRGKLEGGVTSGDVDKQVVNSGIRSDKIMWIEGTEENLPGLNNIVSKMDEILWEFNRFLKNKYFINGRTKEDGGLLRILPSESDDHVDIAPIENRLLFFWSDKRSPHEVQPAFKTRYAVTVWYMDQQERQLAKQRSKVGEIDKVHTAEEYTLTDRYNNRAERDEINRKIEDAASQAVDSLSLEELQAMHSMIVGQPNPDEILAEIGIASNIRDKLLHKLKEIE
ncbi:hypothetical protein ACF0H5_002794 [Mactra antiquata]